MKLAIIIAGQPRFRWSLKDLTDRLKGYDQIDWFFYLWKISPPRYVPTGWENIHDTNRARSIIERSLPERQYLRGLEIVDPDSIMPIVPIVPNMVYQFTSLYNVDLIRQSYEQNHSAYDLVFRTRLDCPLAEDVDLSAIRSEINNNPNLIYTPINIRHTVDGKGLCDHMAISSSQNISIYTDVINHYTDLRYEGVWPQAETFLYAHLMKNNIVLRETLPNLDNFTEMNLINNCWV